MEVRHRCPNAKITLQVEVLCDIVELQQNELCDVISFAPRPALMSKWTPEPQYICHCESAKQSLAQLQIVHNLLQFCEGSKVELTIRHRSSHTKVSELHAIVVHLAHKVVQLRAVESLPELAAKLSPLSHLRTLSFVLSNRPDLLPDLQAAIQSLPVLEELQLFTRVAGSSKHIHELLSCLPGLPNVTSLTIAPYSGINVQPLVLSALQLPHITLLQLGRSVTVDGIPARLEHVHMEDVQHTFEGHLSLFSYVAQAQHPVQLTLNAVTDEAIQQLPSNLQHLSLLQLWSDIPHDLDRALMRLSSLTSLHMGAFLTVPVINVLSGIILPNLSVLGFSLYPPSNEEYHHHADCAVVDGHRMTISPLPIMGRLAGAFPMLQHFHVDALSSRVQCSTVLSRVEPPTVVGLDCWFVRQEFFSLVRGLSACCRRVHLQLYNVPASCYTVIKSYPCN